MSIKAGKSKAFKISLTYPGQNLGSRYILVYVTPADALGKPSLANNLAVPLLPTDFL